MLNQHISKPTREREGQRPTVDDLILSTDKEMVENIQHIGHLGASDHHLITFDMISTFRKTIKQTKTRLKYNQTDLNNFSNHMKIDWENELQGKNSNEAYDLFLSKYNEAVDLYVPKTTVTTTDKYIKPVWMKQATLNLIKRKKHAHIKYLNTRARYDNYAYKSLRNQVTSATRRDRIAFERNISKEIKNNNKLFWRYVNSQRNTKTTIPDLKRKDGSLTSDDREKAELLNDQFCSVLTNEDTTNIPDIDPLPTNTKLENIEVKTNEVIL